MGFLRRRLASCALALALLQGTLLFAAPVSACCRSGTARIAAEEAHECCPAGAHAPGQCPLHKQAQSRQCAFRCDASHAPDFVLGAIGMLTPPAATLVDPAAVTTRTAVRPPALLVRTTLPDAPPPKSL